MMAGSHRREVVLRRTRFKLRKAEDRAEVLEGYIVALSNLDEFIRIIRNSRNREEAKVRLLAFEWSRQQVEAWSILIREVGLRPKAESRSSVASFIADPHRPASRVSISSAISHSSLSFLPAAFTSPTIRAGGELKSSNSGSLRWIVRTACF